MEPHEELNLTPYLDILMNLIVFVMLSGVAAFGQIPATAVFPVAEGPPSGNHSLRVLRDGFVFDGEAVAKEQLPARLRAAAPHTRKLALTAEPEVTLDALVQAMDTARTEHFDEVTLSD